MVNKPSTRKLVKKIITGGQTGVDRAALDAAVEFGLKIGGWCPRGRKAEDGVISSRYPLQETPSDRPSQRTEWNVRDSDGTLVLTLKKPTGGTAFTIRAAHRLNKPCLTLNLADHPTPDTVSSWVQETPIRVLNVAGPRESSSPGIYAQAFRFLRGVFS